VSNMSRGWIRDNWLGLSMAGACLGAAWWVGRTDPYFDMSAEHECQLVWCDDCVEQYCPECAKEVNEHGISGLHTMVEFEDGNYYCRWSSPKVRDADRNLIKRLRPKMDEYWKGAESFELDDEEAYPLKRSSEVKVVNITNVGDKVYVTIRFPDTDEYYGYEDVFVGDMGDVMLNDYTNSRGQEITFDAEGFGSEQYETEGERCMRRLNEMIDSMQEFADEYLARHPVDGNSTQYPDMKVVLPSDDHEDYLEVDNGMVKDTTHAQELAANMVLRAMDMRDMLDDLDMNIEYEAESFNTEMNAESYHADSDKGHWRWVVGEGYSGRAKCKVCGEIISKGQPTIDYHSTGGIMSIHSRPEDCGVKRAESFNAQMMPPVEGEVKIVKDVTPKGGKTTVEECIDIQAIKADAGPNYYRVKFREPADFENFRVPAWAARAANTMGSKYYDVAGSKVTMGQLKDGGAWKIQSIMVPNKSQVNPELALKIANHIQDRLEKEGKWASKKCQDRETVLIVG